MEKVKIVKTTKICKSSAKIKGCDDGVEQHLNNFYPGKAQCKDCLKQHIKLNTADRLNHYKNLKTADEERKKLSTENVTAHDMVDSQLKIDELSQEIDNYKIRIVHLIEQLDEKEKVILNLKRINENLQGRVADLEETDFLRSPKKEIF
jgi:hypothetical protein